MRNNQLQSTNGDVSNFHYIIPVFNTPIDMLEHCVNSIHVALTNAGRDTKCVLLLDDCSCVDYSEQIQDIIHKYGISYHRLQKNAGGLFWTRMEALKLINPDKNDYICFVDSDDEISPDYQQSFEKEYKNLGNFPDIYQMNLLEIKSTSKRLHINSADKNVLVNTRWNLNGKFFRASLFDTAMKHEELKCFFGEDLIHSILMYPYIKTIYPCANGYHIYYVREKTEAEGTEYRKDEEETKRKMEAYEKLIEKACQLTKMKDPRIKITKDSKVFLMIETITEEKGFAEVYQKLMDNFNHFHALISNYMLKINIRSTVPNRLFAFPTHLKADQYEEITDLDAANKGLAKYYKSLGCQLLVLIDGELLTGDEYFKRYLDGSNI